MQRDSASHQGVPRLSTSARTKLLVSLGAAIASLIAVGVVLIGAGHANGSLKYLQAGFALVSVSVSWTLVHTVFTLRHARLYYSGRAGGIDFNDAGPRSTCLLYTSPSPRDRTRSRMPS